MPCPRRIPRWLLDLAHEVVLELVLILLENWLKQPLVSLLPNAAFSWSRLFGLRHAAPWTGR
jgi:hypothetical protein